MFTQCPDCSTAFRVTADVLKQAAGKVRCGGCGNAFNALEYLSETRPEQKPAREPDAALPELKPDPPDDGGGLPASISAAQSAALLKTLDQLAGSDIRIEDTGVEWRVLDEDEASEPAAGDAIFDEADAGESVIDEFLDDSPTPVDEFLTATPNEIEAAEIFSEEATAPEQTPVEELRFDDNTPLPEDFDLEDLAPAAVAPPEQAQPPEFEIPDDEPQPDVALGDPDEWEDLLHEFDDLADAVAEPPDQSVEEPPAPTATAQDAENIEVRVDDVEAPLDMDTQFALQAEAMGIDLTGRHDVRDEAEAAADDLEIEATTAEPALADDADSAHAPDDEDDFEIPDAEPEDEDEDEILGAEPEDEGEDEEDFELLAQEPLLDDQIELLDDVADEEDDGANDDQTWLADDDGGFDVELDLPEDEQDDDELQEIAQLDLIGDDDVDDGDVLDVYEFLDDEDSLGEPPEAPPAEVVVPPLTEEEQTINMMIDQDLMALAIEDEDGFASTIVIPEDRVEAQAHDETDDGIPPLAQTAGFETIIMEGEEFRDARDKAKMEADAAAAAELAKQAAAAREAEKAANRGNTRWGMIAATILLVLLLGVQVVHQSREALATIPAVNKVIGPVYRAIGQPLAPAWNIKGWRFEATKGNTDEDDAELTIYSRLGNKSDQPLPYPLISISLTDRFEETIASRMLDPADYLPSDLDPSKLVQPGNTFNAVISIPSPAADATGFKLNVCYRLTGGQLRCADENFK